MRDGARGRGGWAARLGRVAAVAMAMVLHLATPAAAGQEAGQEPPLALGELVDLALGHNPQVQQAQANLEAARGRLMQTNSGFWPQLGGQASWQAGRDEYSSSGSVETKQRLVGLGLSQSLINIPLWSQSRGGELEARAYAAQVDAAANEVAAEVRAVYLELMAAERLLLVFLEQERDTAAFLERARKLLEHGLAAPLDVARARLDLAQAQRRVIEGRAAVRRFMARLAAAVGLPQVYGLPLAPLGPGAEAGLRKAMDMGEAGLITRAIASRAEVRRLELLARAAEASLEAARAGDLPTLDLQAGAGQTGKYDLDSQYYSYGLFLELPIFTGFRLRGSVVERAGLARAAWQAREQQAMAVRLQVQLAWQGLIESQAKVSVSESQLASAAENYRLIKGRYDNGLATPLELSEARTQRFNAQAELERAGYGVLSALSEMDRSLGGGAFPLEAAAAGTRP